MFKLYVFFLCLTFLSPFAIQGNETIAKDDLGPYTLTDLNVFMELKNYGILKTLIPKIIETRDLERKSVAEKAIKDLAFQTELVTEDIQNGSIDPEIGFFVREKLRTYVLENNVKQLNEDSRVTSGELELAYKERKAEFKIGERRKVSVLYKVFPDNREMRQSLIRTLERIREKPDFNDKFSEYVKEYSDLPGARKGGIVDYFTRGAYGPIFEKYAFQTPKGEISPVFSATKGAYIVKCLDIIPAGYQSLDEVKEILREPIFKRKFNEARDSLKKRLKENNKIEIVETLPQKGSSDLILLKVNDYVLTSGTLFSMFKELGNDPSRILAYLEKTAEKEAMVQEWEKEAKKDPLSPRSRELEIYRIITYFGALFSRIEYQSFDVSEEEMKEYYNENKGAYHETTPKRLSYILFNFPTEKNIPEPEFYKKLENLQRDVHAFRKNAAEKPGSFLEEAKKTADTRKDASLLQTEWIQSLPEDWKGSSPFIDLTLGSISPVVSCSRGLLVFKVMEIGEPPLLPFEDVKQKVYSVLYSKKSRELYEKLQEETLVRNHFKILISFK